MLSGPVVGMVWAGKNVVKTGRVMLGETNPLSSLPGTIRGDFAIDVGRNICHGSDSVESAEREIALVCLFKYLLLSLLIFIFLVVPPWCC
jgi:nucleoside-diphosphate kinase